jgi:purine-nucleoside phosphorylase
MRFLRTIGADAVGFSTVMETIAGVHAGMQVLGLSVITNMCLPDELMPADVDAIIETADHAAPRLAAIIFKVLGSMDG